MATNNNANGTTVNFETFKTGVGNAYTRAKNIFGCAGKEKNRIVQELNQDAETFKGGLMFISDITGFTDLKKFIVNVMEAGANAGTKDAFLNMAAEVRAAIDKRINNLMKRKDEDSISKAMTLKAIIAKDGTKLDGQSLLDACVSGLLHIATKVSVWLKKWFGVNENAPEIIKLIGSALGALFGFIKSGIKIVFDIAVNAISYVVAGVIKIAAWIINTIKNLFGKAKSAVDSKLYAETDSDEEFEDDKDYPSWVNVVYFPIGVDISSLSTKELVTCMMNGAIKFVKINGIAGTPLKDNEIVKYIVSRCGGLNVPKSIVNAIKNYPGILDDENIRAMIVDVYGTH